MAKEKVLQFENFILGMRRDGALTQEMTRDENTGANPYILHSLKTLENYDIDPVDGGLVTRDGYERYNSTVLADSPKQIFYHTDLARTENIILGIVGNRWYKIIENSAHDMVIDEAVTLTDGFKKPVFYWGGRMFFATDSGWYWTDRERLYDGTKYYQAGIDKPSSPLIIVEKDAEGQLTTTGAIEEDLNAEDHRKESIKLVTTNQIEFDVINVYLKRSTLSLTGNIRVSIYTDSSGEPSGMLAETNSQSDWLATELVNVTAGFIGFTMPKTIHLAPDTYWIVLEGDTNYYNNYVGSGGSAYYVSMMYLDLGFQQENYSIKLYDYDSETWGLLADAVGIFYFGGLVPASGAASGIYEYVYTFVNSTYQVESRPSDYQRKLVSGVHKIFEISSPQSADEQVDKIRIYRRILDYGLDITASVDTITADYHFVAEIDHGDIWHDAVSESGLGAVLQTTDHYRIGEPDDTSDNFRDAVIPAGACDWKGRVWIFAKNDNVLYFSKKLTENGRTGLSGDPIPDYFPPENKLEIEEESAILAIRKLANDQLAIYFRNGTIFTLWGMDEIANPPSDYSLRPQVYGLGLISSFGLTDYKSAHVYISRHGLYAFSGAPNPEYLSESIQSILDDISDTNLAKAVVIARGEEIWLLVDGDADGYNDTIYILNLQKSVKPWRRYTFGTNINDLVVKTLSSSSKDILAADDTNKYLLELNVGTTDNGAPINSYLESHRQKVSNAFIYELEIKDRYDDDDIPANYDFLITDTTGYGTSVGINPSGGMDYRGHKTGMRLKSSGTFNVRLDQVTVKKTDLLGVYIRYSIM